MKFNNQICTTKEQSERLLALGLKKETADMCIHTGLQYPIVTPYNEVDEFYYKVVTPAWSLHRLIEMLPQEVIVSGTEYKLSIDSYLCIEYISEELSNPIKYFWDGNVFDRIICCIKWLIEEGHFNKEYLEE